MVNAVTAMVPLLTISETNTLYYNFSILFFSLIATINHILPDNLDGLTHMVKLLFSNVLFSLIGLNPLLGVFLSLSDMIPVYVEEKFYKKLGEKFMQYPRQLIEVYLISTIFNEHKVDCSLMILFKLAYFFERRARINDGRRNDYSIVHSAEHLGLYLLFKDLQKTTFDLKVFLILVVSLVIMVALFLNYINHYIEANCIDRAPDWVRNDSALKAILTGKISKNKQSHKLHNFIVKPWLGHMKLEFITWKSIECHCNNIIDKINPNSFDVVVGIVTGGSFIGSYLAKKLNKPFLIINSKLWSESSFTENVIQSYSCMLGYDFEPRIGQVPEVKGKRILLADDTTYSGQTFKNVTKKLLENGQAKSVETVCLWVRGENLPNYFHSNKRVPIIWEWGSEVD